MLKLGTASRCRGLIAKLICPLRHLAQASPVGIDESDCTRRASSCAGGVAAAQVALLHLASFFHVIDRAKRASDRANLAAHAGTLVDDLSACRFVNGDGFYRAGMQAPSFVALGAGVRHFFASVVKVENLDAGFRSGKRAVVLKRTSHFTLHTSGAFVRVDVQYLLHVSNS